MKIVIETPIVDESDLDKFARHLNGKFDVMWEFLILGEGFKAELEDGKGIYLKMKTLKEDIMICIAEEIK